MNCTEVRENLPALAYGELAATIRGAVESHLVSCLACRQELAAMERIRGALDTIVAPSVQIDVPRLFQDAAARQARRVRRWRRTALAVFGIAASLMLALLLRLQVRVEANQLTIRWAGVSIEEKNHAATPVERVVAPRDPAELAALEERVRFLDELLHALITDVGDRDDRQTERVARLRVRVEELLGQNSRRLSETERNVAAVVTALSHVPGKGEKP
jgi:predicted anti-sigma-YlaC factor YlaD